MTREILLYMRNNLIIVIFIIFISGCADENTIEKNQHKFDQYKLVEMNGILVEQFDSTIIDENKYNYNNITYAVGSTFKYKFEHRTIDNKIKFFKNTRNGARWEFVDPENADSTAIKTIEISVANGNSISKDFPDYNQTVLHYKIGSEETFSKSGAIENEGNVWIHPPRKNYFEILELNPFPYIKTPYKIGTKWTWKLKIGDHWSNKHWKVWNGEIENKCNYEITDKVTLKTNLGNVDCFEVTSIATSSLGETKLVAYFNLIYGFIKLDYTNIDGSKIILELIEYSESITAGDIFLKN